MPPTSPTLPPATDDLDGAERDLEAASIASSVSEPPSSSGATATRSATPKTPGNERTPLPPVPETVTTTTEAEAEADTTNPSDQVTETNEATNTSLRVANCSPQYEVILCNRIMYLSLLLALVSPIVNAVVGIPQTVKAMGITLSLMIWLVVGVFCSALFSYVMSTVFVFLGLFSTVLDFLPAIGSALWAVGSTALLVAVLSESGDFISFMFNLLLFALAIANFLLSLPILPSVASRAVTNTALCSSLSTYSFRSGQCFLKLLAQTIFSHERVIKALSVPQAVLEDYRGLKARSERYLTGEDISSFRSELESWQLASRTLGAVFMRRRLFLMFGYIVEFFAVLFVIVLVSAVDLSRKEFVAFGNLTTFNSLSVTPQKILLSFLLSWFSLYLWMVLDIELTVTTEAEWYGLILSKMSSRWRFARSTRWVPSFARGRAIAMQASALPMVGIVVDEEESERAAQTILRNFATYDLLVCVRTGPDTVHIEPYGSREEEREGFERYSTEPVELNSTDTVLFK